MSNQRISTLLPLVVAVTTGCTGGMVGTGDGVVQTDEVPEVGWQAEFTTRAHDVAGRAVILDENTIELQDFTYDGGGVNARMFLLADGEAFHDTYEMTDNLVGRKFVEDTLTLDIPEDATFEDFNLITLWCVPFSAEFGSGVFRPPQ